MSHVSLACLFGLIVPLKNALFRAEHSLIDQSLHSRLGAETTNGDGFGLGWYDAGPAPGISGASSRPGTTRTCASSRPISARPSSSRTSARRSGRPCSRPTATRSGTAAGCSCTTGSSTGSPRQARPSARGRRIPLSRDRGGGRHRSAVLPRADPRARGRPSGGGRRAIGLVEAGRRRHRIKYPFQGTIATTDGERMWVFRYSSEGKSRSLFFTKHLPTLRTLFFFTRNDRFSTSCPMTLDWSCPSR